MATGIPSKKQANMPAVRLEYEGKTPEREVLDGPTAELKSILSVAPTTPNKVLYGDNLRILRSLLNDPNVKGQVKLIYIDPPYATGGRFECRQQSFAYDDSLSGAAYLEFLRQRLIVMKELLAEEGSIYVHLDDNAIFHAKLILDELFGSDNFRNLIARKKCNPKNYTRKTYGNVADYILFYAKSDSPVWNQPFEPWNDATALKEYQYLEEGTGRRYKKVPIHAPGVRNGATGQPWRGMLPPPGKHWQYTPDKLDEMDARGEIYWSSTGNPRRKVYLENSKGIPIQDIWMDFKDAHNQNIKITGYPTEKNPDLLERIILASSNEGDLVLDAFGGSGTTACTAEKLNRRWITIDSSPLAIDTTMKRLALGTNPMGDFVKKDKAQHQQPTLFNSGRVLSSGFSLFSDNDDSVSETIDRSAVEAWTRLFEGQTMLA